MGIVMNGFQKQRKEDYTLIKNSMKIIKILNNMETFSLNLVSTNHHNFKPNTTLSPVSTKIPLKMNPHAYNPLLDLKLCQDAMNS